MLKTLAAHTPLSIPFASFLYFTPIFSRILF
jgi:hypothetical protein